MKAILISIQPKWCELIANGRKTIEVRKTRPKIETPFKAYIYCCKAKSQWRYSNYEGAYENSKGEIVYAQQHIIGEFVCDRIIEDERGENADVFSKYALLSIDEQKKYGANKPLYGWHISDLKIYDKPKELWEFYTLGNCEKYDFCNQCKNFHRGQGWLDGSYFDEDSCLDNTRIPVTRAPQSWCYVEGLL